MYIYKCYCWSILSLPQSAGSLHIKICYHSFKLLKWILQILQIWSICEIYIPEKSFSVLYLWAFRPIHENKNMKNLKISHLQSLSWNKRTICYWTSFLYLMHNKHALFSFFKHRHCSCSLLSLYISLVCVLSFPHLPL